MNAVASPADPLHALPEPGRGSVFCLGVGGMGVAPLALHLAGRGWTVRGCDDALSPEAARALESGGVELWGAAPLPADTAAVVYSSAVAEAHPRRQEAAARGWPQIRRGHALAGAVHGRRLVAVVGAHGKTTTTAMAATAALRSGYEGGWILGGLMNGDAPAPAGAGRADWILAEVDESDGTIEALSPEITVCTNVDWDHSDHYPRAEDFEAAFQRIFQRTRGPVLIQAGCAASRRAAAGVGRERCFTFGPEGDFALLGCADGENGSLLELGGRFGRRRVELPVRGAFNALNAVAALAAVELMGLRWADDALARYAGVRRRQGILPSRPGVRALEDYAHHPTEIRALLESLRPDAGGRLVVVFQPHRHSRTASFRGEFAAALSRADQLFLAPVYSAGERPVPGGEADDLLGACAAAGLSGRVRELPHGAEAESALLGSLRQGDLLSFVGAGDISRLARRVAARLALSGLGDGGFSPVLSAGSVLLRGEPLAARTTIGIGGPAQFYAEPANEADLAALLREASRCRLPVHVIGRGSNLLVPDEGVEGVVVRLSGEAWCGWEALVDGSVWAGAGLRLKRLCGLAASTGLAGFEFLEGIPGTVGGALRMNAGAMGGWMSHLLAQVRWMSPEGEVRLLEASALGAGYRECPALDRGVALAARLLPKGLVDADVIAARIREHQEHRRRSQPREPSAGCVFRNPPGESAGRLIDEAGLKGLSVGDAQISPVHANFIINRGEATAAEFLELARIARRRVRAHRGIALEPEVQLLGRDWRNYF